ncbi:MAG TPA: methyltransferase domain-containing protein [Tepidisphaeraceae bacterium]|jgi:SAM-dependent methyltransferase
MMGHSPLIDVRFETEFLCAHSPTAANIPLEEIGLRLHELPARHQRIRVTDVDPSRAQAAFDFLSARGHATRIELADTANFTAAGPSTVRLWQPSPFLIEALDFIQRERNLTGLSAIDVACGAGRDAVYLALRGLNVTAIDLLPDALARANDLARRSGVALSTIQHDVERQNTLPTQNTADVVTVFRYLHRPLFPALANAITPGGYVIYETFHARNRETGQRPHNPEHLLDTSELPAFFPGFDILIARDAWEREGRFFSSLLAQRPANVR